MDSVDHARDAAGQARGPARTQAIAARWLSLLLAVSAAVCARADPVAPIDDQALVGLTVAEAIRRAGIRPEAVRLYTEPPGVPRGVGGADERGHRVIVFFARGGRPLDLSSEGAAQRYAAETVIGVARVDGRTETCVGAALWHFCAARPR